MDNYILFDFITPRKSGNVHDWFIECLESIDAPIGDLIDPWIIFHDRYQNANYLVMLKDRLNERLGFVIAFGANNARQAMMFQLQYNVKRISNDNLLDVRVSRHGLW